MTQPIKFDFSVGFTLELFLTRDRRRLARASWTWCGLPFGRAPIGQA